jgi:type I restriction enzyme R subunit
MVERDERQARDVIDDLLRAAGWDPHDPAQVGIEVTVSLAAARRIGETPAAYDDGQIARRADYVLWGSQGQALAIIEAKRGSIEPYTAKQQALAYARALEAPFIFLTNGSLIYFWDYQDDDARSIDTFYSRRDLERLIYLRRERKPLATVPIPETYVRQGELRDVRLYQQEAMRALDRAVELGKRRFLLELPTGTGKTDVLCLYLKRLIAAGRAERVLWLVDRDPLAEQALAAMQDILPEYGSYWLRAGMEMQEQQITVCLLQTMIGRYEEFTSGAFDVVVADECHRSIYGEWRPALTRFDALHVGLTATPAAYIERNTFQFYQCPDGQPDFAYPITRAFEDKYLIPYTFATGVTEIIAHGADTDEEYYDPAEFERKWTNEDTNRKMMEAFDSLAWENYRDLAPGQATGPGKAIVFAITKHHAARLAHYLNERHPDLKGQYAEVITSDTQDPAAAIRRFKRPNEYPMVAVSVGMLDTGFDCREVLHLVMCRRVRSPILYQQMRGRGTRTAPHIGKRRFVIYDFFRNHEYFQDSETAIFTGGATGTGGTGGAGGPWTPRELIELGLEDEWLQALTYVEVGPGGERIDKEKYRDAWERTVRAEVEDDRLLARVRDSVALTVEEEDELAERLNRPAHYFNEENLRRAYRYQSGTLVDFIRVALGQLQLKSDEEILTENFHAWLVGKNLTPEQAQYLSLLKNRGIVRGQVALADLFQPPLSVLNAAAVGIELFGEQGLRAVVDDLNESVFARRAG